MLEALMLVLLGMLIMTLVSLALAPVLWARAARITTEKVQQDVHSAAFSEAAQSVSQKYEGELAQRETAMRTEIEQLEASREKISAEASGRVNQLEETRNNLEQQVAVLQQTVADLEHDMAERDGRLEDATSRYKALSESIGTLGARADALGREAADLGSRAENLSGEISGLGQSHHEIAQSLHMPQSISETADTTTPMAAAPESAAFESADDTTLELSETVTINSDMRPEAESLEPGTAESGGEGESTSAAVQAPPEPTLSDRIRALRDGASA
jgi:predicted  nucleic acid-binding Zn-ribbon protein